MRRYSLGTVLLLVVMLLSVFPVGETQAAAYAKWVDAPQFRDNGGVVGTAEINTDCEGTLGCYTYIKIEFQPARYITGIESQDKYFGWQDVNGRWADQGRNEIGAEFVGCGNYRTVVDAYNDLPGDAAIGINLGIVELNLGGDIKRYHKTTESRPTYICVEPNGGSGGGGRSGGGGGGGGGGGWN